MHFLELTLPGDYLDAYLYRGHLYLLTSDSRLKLVEWNALLDHRFRKGNLPTDPLAELLFKNNSLAHSDRRLIQWASYPSFFRELTDRLETYQEIEVTPTASLTRDFDLGANQYHTIELYYSHVWLAGEKGVFYTQAGPGYSSDRRSRIYPLFSERCLAISPGRRIIWAMGPMGLWGFPLVDIKSRRVRVDFGAPTELAIAGLSIGWHWGDFVVAGTDYSSRFFARSAMFRPQSDEDELTWLDGKEGESTQPKIEIPLERQADGRAEAIASLAISDPLRVNGTEYQEIEVPAAQKHRLFCSRERAVGVGNSGAVTPFEWSYDLTFSELASDPLKVKKPSRIMVSTFGWVVESSEGVFLVQRGGTQKLISGEVVQIRTFPDSINYENLVVIVLEDCVKVFAILDYDFLLPSNLRDKPLGRRSDFFSLRRSEASYPAGPRQQ